MTPLHTPSFGDGHRPVVFLAPGSGLGHLVRTGALCLDLEDLGIPTLILCTSFYGPGFSRLTGLRVVRIPSSRWQQEFPGMVHFLDPPLVVQDTFPLGLKGEHLPSVIQSRSLVLLSRRLRFSAYMKAMEAMGHAHALWGFTALILEPLERDHRHWLEMRAQTVVELEGRVRFPVSRISTPPVPGPLDELLDEGDGHLVVHSGPEHETRRLITRAETSIRQLGQGRLAVINPHMAAAGMPNCFDYFPAAALYPRAAHVYTGAGYNAVAETEAFRGKHTMTAFRRHYDDQAWRKSMIYPLEKPGNTTALNVIAAHYRRCMEMGERVEEKA